MSAISVPNLHRASLARKHRPSGRGRWQGLKTWAQLSAGLIAVALAALWITRSALFQARSLVVSGNTHLSKAEVLELAGLRDGANTLWFWPEDVRRRLLSNPWISTAQVSRVLPSTIAVTISERHPIGEMSAGTPLLIAADGTVLGEAGPAVRLPLLRMTARRPPRVGERVGPSQALVAMSVLPAPIRRQVTEVFLDDAGTLTLRLRTGAQAVYGDATRAFDKGAALLSVWRWSLDRDVRVSRIDLRAPLAPAVSGWKPSGASA